jgi:hypothetical protein
MIERVGPSATIGETQGIQPATVPSASTVPESMRAEILVHKATLIGETHWLGAMNAFRIARTFAAQQVLSSARIGAGPADDSTKLSKTTTIPNEIGAQQGTTHAGESTLIPSIRQPPEDGRATNDLGYSFENSKAQALSTAAANSDTTANISLEADQVAASFQPDLSLNRLSEFRAGRYRGGPKYSDGAGAGAGASSSRPVVFRGRLIRLGQTSQFVPELPT